MIQMRRNDVSLVTLIAIYCLTWPQSLDEPHCTWQQFPSKNSLVYLLCLQSLIVNWFFESITSRLIGRHHCRLSSSSSVGIIIPIPHHNYRSVSFKQLFFLCLIKHRLIHRDSQLETPLEMHLGFLHIYFKRMIKAIGASPGN